MNKNRVTPTIVGDDSASKRKVFFANFDNAGHQGGNATNFARTETRADCFVATKKQKHKLLKIIGAGSLAFFMGIGTLCGVMIAPMGATSASNAGDLAALAQSADRAQEKALHDAGVLSGGGLGLDPETDPVIATTDWGLDIKFHADWGSFGTLSSGGLSGYLYFTMGSYSGAAINWVIIGYNASKKYYDGTNNITTIKYGSYAFSDYINQITTQANYYKSNQHETTTDAGSVILGAGAKGLVYDYALFDFAMFTNAVSNSEIPSGCVLCISEKTFGSAAFTTSAGKKCNYIGSPLQSAMQGLYSSSLGLTATQKARVQAQSLTQHTWNGEYLTATGQYFFPLAGYSSSNENFYYSTYLSSKVKRDCDASYYLRSGSSYYKNLTYSAYFIDESGNPDYYSGGGYLASKAYSMRPCFVIKI